MYVYCRFACFVCYTYATYIINYTLPPRESYIIDSTWLDIWVMIIATNHALHMYRLGHFYGQNISIMLDT